MNQSLVKLFLIGLILFVAKNTYSQNNLNESEQKKISVAEKKINKAESIVKKADKYNSQIESLKNDGRVRTGKIQRLETKANRIVIKSSSYYKDGFGKKYGTYRGAVQRHLKNGSLALNLETDKNEAHKTYKTGRKWRRKSKSQGDVNKGVEYLLKANEVEGTAIESLKDILTHTDVKTIQEETVAEIIPDTASLVETTSPVEPIIPIATQIPQDSISAISPDTLKVTNEPLIATPVPVDSVYTTLAQNDSLSTISTDTVATTKLTPENTPVISDPQIDTTIETDPTEDLTTYFTIQFLADKQPVPKEKINSIYNGPLEIIKHKADGWFRYSIGKYSDINKAKEFLQGSGVNGYIVAYHNNNRISTREAIEMLSGI